MKQVIKWFITTANYDEWDGVLGAMMLVFFGGCGGGGSFAVACGSVGFGLSAM